MRERAVEISVKTVFTGRKTQEQAFFDLLLRKRDEVQTLEPVPQAVYTKGMVFPGVQAPERGNRYEQ